MTTPRPRMVRSPHVVSGSWRLEGTRITARLLHDLAVLDGMSIEAILSWYPDLTAEQVRFAVEWFDGAYYRARRRAKETSR